MQTAPVLREAGTNQVRMYRPNMIFERSPILLIDRPASYPFEFGTNGH